MVPTSPTDDPPPGLTLEVMAQCAGVLLQRAAADERLIPDALLLAADCLDAAASAAMAMAEETGDSRIGLSASLLHRLAEALRADAPRYASRPLRRSAIAGAAP